MVPVLTNVGERATAKNYHSISLLSVLSEGFEKLLNNRFFDHFWNFRSAFGLILSFLSNRRLQVVLDGKPSPEYPGNVGVHQDSVLGTKLFLIYINDLPDDFICNIAIYAD